MFKNLFRLIMNKSLLLLFLLISTNELLLVEGFGLKQILCCEFQMMMMMMRFAQLARGPYRFQARKTELVQTLKFTLSATNVSLKSQYFSIVML